MVKMAYNTLQTIEHLIQQYEGDLEGISREIREETNYDDELHQTIADQLYEEWDELKNHLDNLKAIKEFLIQNNFIN
jgi:primosomal protein N''